MKKILLILFPLTIITFLALGIVNADNSDKETSLGNGLTNLTYDQNTYIELPESDPNKQFNVVLPESFEFMASDNELELYLERETLAIAVRVKSNGYVYSSYNFLDTFAGKSDAVMNPIKSGVILEMYNGTKPSSYSYLDSKEPLGTGQEVRVATSTIIPLANGFKAVVDFNHPEMGFRFDLNVTLENGKLVVNIPESSVEEYMQDKWTPEANYFMLRNIILFPYFGSTIGEDDGYIVIPDGSGALIGLDKNPDTKSSFVIDIYGEDAGYLNPTFDSRAFSKKEVERITIPLYGMVHDIGKTGFYAVAEEGANYSQLNYASTGVKNSYYQTYFGFKYRQSYEQYQSRSNEEQRRTSFQDDVNNYPLTVKYTFLTGEEATYVGMAKHYQQDLVQAGVLTANNKTNYNQVPLKIDFIGSEIKEGILSTKMTTITTYEQVVKIIKQLQNDGYNSLNVSYKTYNKDEQGYRFDVYRQLGGKSGFEEMITFFNQDDNLDFSYYLDYVRSYKEYSTGHAQTLSRREITHIELSRMYYSYNVNDTRLYLDYAENDLKLLEKYGILNVSFNGFESAVYTSYNDEIIYSTRNMNEVNNALNYLNENNISTSIYAPDAYMYSHLDSYYDAPLSSSDYSISIASIPFIQLVLNGYVDFYSEYLNFASDETTTLLRLVEYGVFPSYILTGANTYELKLTNSSNVYISEYDVMQDRMALYYDMIEAGVAVSINNEMIDHTFIDEGIVMTSYQDGTKIIINYTNTPYVYQSTTVQGSSYEVIQ